MMALVLAVAGLVGDWRYVPALSNARAPIELCETDNGIRYTRDGRFTTFMADARGRWRLRGRELRERVTHSENEETGRVTAVREPETLATLRWLSPDHVNLVTRAGVQGLIRCRAAR